MKMNLRPSLRFQLWDMTKGCLGFIITMAILVALVPAFTFAINGEITNASISGYGGMAAIFLFVMGIVAPRGYLRLDSQMGVSRATSFTSLLLTALLVTLAMSVLAELTTMLIQAFYRKLPNYTFMDLYQMIYCDGGSMSFGDHMLSLGLNTSMGVCCYIGGMFFTLLFWRLNKLWSIVAAIAMVLVLNFGLNSVALPKSAWADEMVRSLVEAAAKSPLPLIILFAVISLIFALVEWLLLRRAYIRAAV